LALTLPAGDTPGSNVYTLTNAAEPRTTAIPKTVDVNAPGGIRLSGEFEVRVKLDGKDLGELHANAAVAAAVGSHHLELSNAKVFFKEARTVTVNPGQTLTVPLPGTAKLTVETYPSSGMVLVDGAPTQVESDGGTPIQVALGTHTVSIQGHPGSSRSVDVKGDTPLKFKL
jgi:hypothetical protein